MPKTAQIPKTLVCPANKHLLVLNGNHWGAGKNIDDAACAFYRNGGKVEGHPWRVFQVSPQSFVNEIGQIFSPESIQPILIASFDPS